MKDMQLGKPMPASNSCIGLELQSASAGCCTSAYQRLYCPSMPNAAFH